MVSCKGGLFPLGLLLRNLDSELEQRFSHIESFCIPLVQLHKLQQGQPSEFFQSQPLLHKRLISQCLGVSKDCSYNQAGKGLHRLLSLVPPTTSNEYRQIFP
ncbi:hypothetical protein [Bacillus phage PK2]|nr:hypothetical protein [Bacillus phage PK2]